jgi:hypothetical protein
MKVLLADTALLVMLALSGLAILRRVPSNLLVSNSVLRRLPVAILLGASLHMLVGTGWLVTGLPGFLVPSFVLTVLVAIMLGGRPSPRAGRPMAWRRIVRTLVRIGVLIAGTAGLVLVARTALREVVFEDSYDNTALAGLILEGEFVRSRPILPLSRPPGLAILQAPAMAAGALFSVAPLIVLALATWAVVLDVADRATRASLPRSIRRTLLLAATAAVVAMPMVIAQVAHLNTHHLFGGLLLIGVVAVMGQARGGRLRGDDGSKGQRAGGPEWAIVALPLAALVVLRPDGVFFSTVVLALAAVAIADWAPVRNAMLLTGGVTTAWWGYLALRISASGLWGEVGASTSLSDIGSGRASGTIPAIGLGVILIVFGLAGQSILPWWARSSRSMRLAVEISPILVLVVLIVREGELVARSWGAIRSNLVDGTGEWTVGILAIGASVVVAALLTQERSHWIGRYVVTSFLPLMLALRVAEGSAYRIGWVDSLNRSIIHVLPVAILVLLLAATRPPRMGRDQVEGATRSLGIRHVRISAAAAVITVVGVGLLALSVARSPLPYPFASNARVTDAGQVGALRALTPGEHVVAVFEADLGLAFARQLTTARPGWTEIVDRHELVEVLAVRDPDVIIMPECAAVPDGFETIASGAHRPRPGIENPRAADWEQILARGEVPSRREFERWRLVRRTSGDAERSVAVTARPSTGTATRTVDLQPRTDLPTGGGDGLIHHLGTRSEDLAGEVSRFANPARLGLLCLSVSSSLLGGADGITDRSGTDGLRGDGGGLGLLHTDADPVAHVTVELGPDRQLDLTAVAIRQRDEVDANLLRGFQVEVRVGGRWLPVARGRHDGGPGEWHLEVAEALLPGADAVRVSRDGANSSGLGYLVIDDLELYGRLVERLP